METDSELWTTLAIALATIGKVSTPIAGAIGIVVGSLMKLFWRK